MVCRLEDDGAPCFSESHQEQEKPDTLSVRRHRGCIADGGTAGVASDGGGLAWLVGAGQIQFIRPWVGVCVAS